MFSVPGEVLGKVYQTVAHYQCGVPFYQKPSGKQNDVTPAVSGGKFVVDDFNCKYGFFVFGMHISYCDGMKGRTIAYTKGGTEAVNATQVVPAIQPARIQVSLCFQFGIGQQCLFPVKAA